VRAYAVDWIPNNLKTSVCNVAAPGQTLTGTFIANSTAIQDTFKRLADQYSAMFRRKAFLYSYFNEGMDVMEFQEAEANVTDLISEYEQYTVATIDDRVDQWEYEDEFDDPVNEEEEILEEILEEQLETAT
jgi:tubulin beta